MLKGIKMDNTLEMSQTETLLAQHPYLAILSSVLGFVLSFFSYIIPALQAIVQGEIINGWKLNEEKDNYTEAMLVLQDMQQASLRNDNMKNMIIEQGKYKILNQ